MPQQRERLDRPVHVLRLRPATAREQQAQPLNRPVSLDEGILPTLAERVGVAVLSSGRSAELVAA